MLKSSKGIINKHILISVLQIYLIATPTPPSISHRGPHPADSVGLGGFRAELLESQRRRGTREQVILKHPPALETLSSQSLVILTQKLHRFVVLPQTFIPIPLAPQPGGHACGVNALLHPELVVLEVTVDVWNHNKI